MLNIPFAQAPAAVAVCNRGSLIRLARQAIRITNAYFNPHCEVARPDWINCTNRTWRRHSAYLMALHGQVPGDES